MMFRVWAPRAERVDLVLRGSSVAMECEGDGWWRRDADAVPGDLYAFAVDGGPPRPDPRSMDQPEGVHGPSRVVDHAAHARSASSFRAPPLSSAIVYELHVGTFTPEGTLDAAIDRLGHLTDLGVTHVELLPLASFEGNRGWGYDGVSLFAPQPAYTGGEGPTAVKRFVDACHGRDLAVILDVVYNHLGPSGNYLAEFGPYFTDAYVTPWGRAINLDGPGSDQTRSLIVDNALMWLRDYGFDGLRFDAVHAFHDRSAVHVLEEIRQAVDAFEANAGRRVALIAESDLNDPRVVRPPEAGGLGMDAQWSDDFHHALHAVLTGERGGYYADYGRVADLAKAWDRAFVLDGRHSAFRGRRHGRSAAGMHGRSFLAYAQNHDQVGNRGLGERLSHLVPPEGLELAAALVLLSPFVPMLFQGEEWAASSPFLYFTDFKDPALAEAIREGRRREFADSVGAADDVSDPQDIATFERSGLDWDELARPPHDRVLSWHKRLIALRRSTPDLGTGPLGEDSIAFAEQPPWLRVRRGDHVLCFNLGSGGISLPMEDGVSRTHRIALASDPRARFDVDGVRLSGYGVAVLSPLNPD